MQETLNSYPNLTIKAGSVANVMLNRTASTNPPTHDDTPVHGEVTGIQTEAGETIPCEKIIISTGTFLGGQINIGLQSTPFGRIK